MSNFKMNGFQHPLLDQNLGTVALAVSVEGALLSIAATMMQAVIDETVKPDLAIEGLPQRLMMALGAVEEAVEHYSEAMDEAEEEARFEITEEGQEALCRHAVSESQDRSNYQRARSAPVSEIIRIVPGVKPAEFTPEEAKEFENCLSFLGAPGTLHPIFEPGTMLTARGVDPITASELAQELEIRFTLILDAVAFFGVPAIRIEDGKIFYDREEVMNVLREAGLGDLIDRRQKTKVKFLCEDAYSHGFDGDRVYEGEISKALCGNKEKLSAVLQRIVPVADFEGEAIYSTNDVVRGLLAVSIDMDEALPGRPPYFNPSKKLRSFTSGMVSVNDLAKKLGLGFTTVKDALDDGGVPALAFSDGKAFYSLEVAMAALRKSPIGDVIARREKRD
ncbi:hypothetical protein TW83_10105 [Paracoccus sp. S4493]|uniref:hypothetical protein n=1 Tax=Paracoccus sp. S4493 TaxID=579490 RepID=UPI0005FA7AE2|nr:hypothetical protein [Paracoccus sp. S4493]KJZ31263.1 hypothetical protein TW83_10105 [Paracoccus sp. S4493]